jgi:hypothetical protein
VPGEYKFFLAQIARTWPLLLERLRAEDFDPWLLLRWITQALLLTALTIAADYCTGAGILHLLKVKLPPRFRHLAPLALGVGAQGLVVFALGAAGALTVNAVRIGCALPGILGAFIAKPKPPALRLTWRTALAVPALALCTLDWMQPVSEGDSTMYHMPAARWYRGHQALPYTSEIRFNAQPQLSVLLYLRHWMITGEDTLLKLFNLELLLILSAAVLAGCRELRTRHTWLAFASLGAATVFTWMLKIEYADLALAAFTTAGAVLMLGALRRNSLALATTGAAALAIASSVKLQGLVLAAAFAAAFLWSAWRRGWPLSRLSRFSLLQAGLIVVAASGWWLRSWLATGSPAYPFFTATDDLKRLLEVNQTYGFGHSLTDFLLLPWRAFREAPVHFADPYSYGPLLLVLAGTLLTLPFAKKQTGFLALGLGLFFAFWFFSGQVMRYFASTIGVQALLIACLPRFQTPLALALTLVTAGNLAITSPTLLHGWMPPVRLAQKEAVQAETLPYYRAVRALNKIVPHSQSVYTLHCENAKFHLLPRTAGDWFDERSYFWLLYAAPDEAEIIARLRRAGYRYLLISRKQSLAHRGMFAFDLAKSKLMQTWAELPGATRVYDDTDYAAYRIDP